MEGHQPTGWVAAAEPDGTRGDHMPIARTEMFKRSLELSKTSNEHSRAAGQACILINGSAATAVIAYLSKDKLDPSVVPDVIWSLIGYGLGVFFAAVMLFCATQTLDDFSQYWLYRAGGGPYKNFLSRRWLWWHAFYVFGGITFILFLSASVWFARTQSVVATLASTTCVPG